MVLNFLQHIMALWWQWLGWQVAVALDEDGFTLQSTFIDAIKRCEKPTFHKDEPTENIIHPFFSMYTEGFLSFVETYQRNLETFEKWMLSHILNTHQISLTQLITIFLLWWWRKFWSFCKGGRSMSTSVAHFMVCYPHKPWLGPSHKTALASFFANQIEFHRLNTKTNDSLTFLFSFQSSQKPRFNFQWLQGKCSRVPSHARDSLQGNSIDFEVLKLELGAIQGKFATWHFLLNFD